MDLTNINKDRKGRRKSSIDLSTMVYGKVTPQAKDLEEAVLGSIMLEKIAFDTVVEIIKHQRFLLDYGKTIISKVIHFHIIYHKISIFNSNNIFCGWNIPTCYTLNHSSAIT